MEKRIFPQQEWYKAQLDALENFTKNLESKLIGKTIKIKCLDMEANGVWKIKTIKVKGIGYGGNENGYIDVNGPIFFGKNGEGYHTHPDYGIIVLDE